MFQVNNNGHLTFNEPSSQFVPYSFPANRNQDIIAGLWTDLDNGMRGVVSYHQYTSGNVLTRATQDINTHFPNLNFSASWVFVATWDKVAYFSLTNTETSFQVLLISDRNSSFILMNYGEIAVTTHRAGYDTINSTHYIVINGSNSGSSISNLKNSSNVSVSGRWAFRVDEIFYPFGLTVGDKSNPVDDDGSSSVIQLLSPFLFFGRTYQQIYYMYVYCLNFNLLIHILNRLVMTQ
uniref:Si:ch73-329n5.2 n=1 Tax=Cyprinus carpio TaxID=7962 RepID=A0A8C1NUR8_CYPCA